MDIQQEEQISQEQNVEQNVQTEGKPIRTILVYTDLTAVGERSVQWGAYLAEKFKMKLMIVHVINENTYNYFPKNTAEEEVKKVLADYCETIKRDNDIDCEFYVEEGCTCTIINSTAERIDAYLVVLGNHGKNDPQYLSGVSALKIIRKARIPYFVIQKNTPSPNYGRKIVSPIDLSKEAKEKVGWVTYFAKHLDEIIEIVYKPTDDPLLRNNLTFAHNFYDKYELPNNEYAVNRRKSTNELALEFAFDNSCKMMVVTTTKEDSIMYKLFGYPETKILSNEKGIPVLCVNPRKDLYIPCI